MDILLFGMLALGALIAYFGSERTQPLGKAFLKGWAIGLAMVVFAVILGGILMPDGPSDDTVVALLVVGALVLFGMTTMLWALVRFGIQYFKLTQGEKK